MNSGITTNREELVVIVWINRDQVTDPNLNIHNLADIEMADLQKRQNRESRRFREEGHTAVNWLAGGEGWIISNPQLKRLDRYPASQWGTLYETEYPWETDRVPEFVIALYDVDVDKG